MILQKWFDLSTDEMMNAPIKLISVESQFFSVSVRNAAIIGTSATDFLLNDILEKKFLKNDSSKKTLSRLSFDIKINLCNSLGLISDDFASLLHFLRQVRNKFAHEPTPLKLDLPKLKEYHKKLNDEYAYNISYSSHCNNQEVKQEEDRLFLSLLSYSNLLLSYYLERVQRVNDEMRLNLKSDLPTAKIKHGKSISLIEPINLK